MNKRYFALPLALVFCALTACSSNTSLPGGQASPDGYACPEGYRIKGNATSRTGELIYHMKHQDYYYRTEPEVCFATEEDAQAAGYRKSKR